jgi:UbiA prenyltransferase family
VGRAGGGVRALVELVRGPAVLTVPGDVLVGAAWSGRSGRRTGRLVAASACLYWAGMALNDWADREVDAVQRPGRPIPSGRVPAPVALGVAGGLTAAGLAVGGRRALPVAVPLAAAVWWYDLAARSGAAGPAVMGVARGLNVLLGAGGSARAWPAAALVAAHTTAVTRLSTVETVGGEDAVRRAVGLGATAGAVALGVGARGDVPSRAAGVGYLAAVLPAQVALVREPKAERARQAVAAGILGLMPLQAMLLAARGRAGTAAAVAAGWPLARRLARRVSPT